MITPDITELQSLIETALQVPGCELDLVQRSTFGLTYRVRAGGNAIFIKLYDSESHYCYIVDLLTLLERNRFGRAPRVLSALGALGPGWAIALESLGETDFWTAMQEFGTPILQTIGTDIGASLARLHSIELTSVRHPCTNVLNEITQIANRFIADSDFRALSVSTFGVVTSKRVLGDLEEIAEYAHSVVDGYRHAPDVEPVLLHGDLWARNIIITSPSGARGPTFGGFIDFDYAGMGSPCLDIVRFFVRGIDPRPYERLADIRPNTLIWRSFKQAYCNVSPFPLIADEEWHLAALYHLLRTAHFYFVKLVNGDVRGNAQRFQTLLSCLREVTDEHDSLLSLRTKE